MTERGILAVEVLTGAAAEVGWWLFSKQQMLSNEVYVVVSWAIAVAIIVVMLYTPRITHT